MFEERNGGSQQAEPVTPVILEGMDEACSMYQKAFQHGRRVRRLFCGHMVLFAGAKNHTPGCCLGHITDRPKLQPHLGSKRAVEVVRWKLPYLEGNRCHLMMSCQTPLSQVAQPKA